MSRKGYAMRVHIHGKKHFISVIFPKVLRKKKAIDLIYSDERFFRENFLWPPNAIILYSVIDRIRVRIFDGKFLGLINYKESWLMCGFMVLMRNRRGLVRGNSGAFRL